jgi:hypothetical protein
MADSNAKVEEIRAMNGKQVPLIEEVGHLKDAIQQMPAKMSNQFHQSMKKCAQ